MGGIYKYKYIIWIVTTKFDDSDISNLFVSIFWEWKWDSLSDW